MGFPWEKDLQNSSSICICYRLYIKMELKGQLGRIGIQIICYV